MKNYGFALGIAMTGVLSLGSATQAQEVTLRLGHATFESHPYHDAAVRFRDAMAEKTNGEVDVQIFPARQLGDVKELMEGVQFGTVDMTVNSSSAMSDLAPALDALQLPWLIDSYEHFAKLAVTPEAEALTQDLANHGVVSLGIYDGGRRHFLTVPHMVRTIEDMRGLKTRVAPVRLHLDIWQAVGVNPTPMAYGEVYTGLETGTLDAVETNITSVNSEKYFEVAKNMTLTGHYFWPALLLINKAKFDSLSPEHQEAMREAAGEVVQPQVMAIAELDKKLIEDLGKEGFEFTEASPELLSAMRAAVEPVYETYTEKSPAIRAFVDAAERLRAGQ